MSLARQQSVFTYASSSGGATYYFDIVVDAQGLVSVKDIRSPRGAVDSTTAIPSLVLDDIERAKTIVVQLVEETEVDTGSVVFTGQTSRPVVIAGGVLNNTEYRVVYVTPDGTILTTENKTILGFDVVAPAAYGTVAVPITVGYVVLVATQQSSTTGGTLTITDADGSTKAVTFATAFETDDYRVILSEGGFFKARVTNQTKTGFTVQLPFTVPTGQSVTVGYDVFVG